MKYLDNLLDLEGDPHGPNFYSVRIFLRGEYPSDFVSHLSTHPGPLLHWSVNERGNGWSLLVEMEASLPRGFKSNDNLFPSTLVRMLCRRCGRCRFRGRGHWRGNGAWSVEVVVPLICSEVDVNLSRRSGLQLLQLVLRVNLSRCS